MEYTDKAAYRTLTNKLSTFRDSSLDPKTLADELQERNDIGKTAYEHAQNPKHEKSERRRELIVAVMGNGRVGVFQDLVESLLLMQGFDWLGRELKETYIKEGGVWSKRGDPSMTPSVTSIEKQFPEHDSGVPATTTQATQGTPDAEQPSSSPLLLDSASSNSNINGEFVGTLSTLIHHNVGSQGKANSTEDQVSNDRNRSTQKLIEVDNEEIAQEAGSSQMVTSSLAIPPSNGRTMNVQLLQPSLATEKEQSPSLAAEKEQQLQEDAVKKKSDAYSKLYKEYKSVKEKYDEKEKHLQDTKQNLANLRTQCAFLEKTLIQKSEEISHSEQEKRIMLEDIALLKEKLSEKEWLLLVNERLYHEKNELLKQKLDAKEEFRSIENENSALKSKMCLIEDKHKVELSLKEKEVRLENAEKYRKKAEDDCKKAMEDCKRAEEEYRRAKEDCKRTEDECKMLKEKLQDSEKKCKTEEKRRYASEAKYHELEESVKNTYCRVL